MVHAHVHCALSHSLWYILLTHTKGNRSMHIDCDFIRIEGDNEIPFIVPLSHSMQCNGPSSLYLHQLIVAFLLSLYRNARIPWIQFAQQVDYFCCASSHHSISNHITNQLYSIKIIHGTDGQHETFYFLQRSIDFIDFDF